jgi:hypothetical protein
VFSSRRLYASRYYGEWCGEFERYDYNRANNNSDDNHDNTGYHYHDDLYHTR